MAKTAKNSLNRENSHLKPLPQEFLATLIKNSLSSQVKNIWCQNQREIKKQEIIHDKKLNLSYLRNSGSIIDVVALNTLFPGNLVTEMIQIQSMPEATFEQKLLKEQAFLQLLLSRFTIKHVLPDKNCAIRAVILGLNPDLDPRSERITAIILRGDIVDYVMRHPTTIEGGNDKDVLNGYCFEMIKCEMPVGVVEIAIMSEILETPIHLYSYDDAYVKNAKLWPGTKSIYGGRYHGKKPILLYFNPLSKHFAPLYPKKSKKFGI